jgi:hypothetical protein
MVGWCGRWLINFDVRNCRRRAKNCEKWRNIIKEGSAHSRGVQLVVVLTMVVLSTP